MNAGVLDVGELDFGTRNRGSARSIAQAASSRDAACEPDLRAAKALLPAVIECTVSPECIYAGGQATLQVRISNAAPPGGLFVRLDTRGDPVEDTFESLPRSLVVPGGARCASIRLQSRRRCPAENCIKFVAASAAGAEKTSQLTVIVDAN